MGTILFHYANLRGRKESRDKPTVSHKICHIFGKMLQQHASIITINAFGMLSARTNSSHMGQITTTSRGTVINPFACEESRVESGVKTFAKRYTKDEPTYTHIHTTYIYRDIHILPASCLPQSVSLSRSTRLELMLCKLTLGTAEEAVAEHGGHLESITKWWMCNFLWSVRNFFYVRVRKLDCISLFCTCLSKFSHLPVERKGKKERKG